MKSRTSFFNGTVLKKDILRFAPIWAVYTVILLFYTFVVDRPNPTSTAYVLSGINTVPSLYAFVCATFLFGDLFKTKMCNALHAMPLRRETFLCTHLVSGILFALVPYLLCCIGMCFMAKDFPALPWLWLAANMGKFLFYFSLAIFSVMCVGNRLGHIVVYVFLLSFFLLILLIYNLIYQPLLRGIELDTSFFQYLCPNVYFSFSEFFNWQRGDYSQYYTYNGLIAENWIYLGVCVLVGAALLFAAFRLYRRRNLENAGNFICSKPVAYAFLALGSMLFAIIIPIVGFVLAFIGICMLMERTLKVFHKKNIIMFAAFAGTVVLTIGLTLWDPLGVTRYIPETEKVQSVYLGSYSSNQESTFTTPEDIRLIQDVHSYALTAQEPEDDSYYCADITYTLKNGRTVRRVYNLDVESAEMDALKMRLSSMDALLGTDDLAELKKNMRSVSGRYVNSGSVDYVLYDYEGLLNALAQDAKEGKLAQDSNFYTSDLHGILFITFADEHTVNLLIYNDCTHTLEFLKDYQ